MADIKKGLKRTERVLLILGVVGAFVLFSSCILSMVIEDFKPVSGVININLLQLMCFAPYIVFKFISWIVMGFLDDDEVKDKEK